MIDKIWLFVIAIVCCGCGVSSVSYPSWYITNAKDSQYLYGVGQAKDLQGAKLAALNDLASQISLNIESSLKIHKSNIDSNISSEVSNDIGVNVSDIELDSVEYPIVEHIDDMIFIQARIDKDKFLSKLNNDINLDLVAVNSLLNEIKISKCNTISPKDKYKLRYFMSGVVKKSQQITSLGGKVEQNSAIENIQKLASTPSSAYYVSFATGGNSSAYELVDNGLISEYTKFFSIIPKDSSVFYIENTYEIFKLDSATQIKLTAIIKDCNGNAVFSANLESTNYNNKTIQDITTRLRAQLYKKLNTWVSATQ